MPTTEIAGATALVTSASRSFGRCIATALSQGPPGRNARMNDAAPGAGTPSRRAAVPPGPLYVRDHPGASTAIVMMHGFPDDSRIYDRLIPPLAPHRAVAFGWLGYGRSGRTEAKRFTFAEHQVELGAVLDTLESASLI